MSLEDKMSAAQIVSRIGMHDCPSSYSGRGAIIDDLTDSHLESIFGWIEQEHGKDAAQNFAQMVADIPILSATDFLLSLYRLEAHNWKWDKKYLRNNKGIYLDDEGSVFGTVMSTLFGIGRNETDYIRGEFLRRHKIKQPKKANYNNMLE